MLTRKDAPELVTVIGETALREPICVHPAMADQMRYIVKLGEQSNITVQVLPIGSPQWHPAHAGAYILFEFPKSAPIVHLEHLSSSAFLRKGKDVSTYQATTTTLRQLAMSPADSVEFIARLGDELEGTA